MSNSDNICNDVAYQNMITQRRRFQLFNVPPVRYDNLANNPYDKIHPNTNNKLSKFDLDMRRKVEILKYYANNSNTQTNRFTKAEIYAQAVSGKYQQRTYSNTFISENISNNRLICPPVKTPTSSCDVPGPIIYLYEDENVPLYNYRTNIDSNYGIITQGVNPYGKNKTWNSYIEYDKMSELSASNKLSAIIASIFIYYADVPSKNFTITTPIALKYSGNNTGFSNSSHSVVFKIDNISTNILFNNDVYSTTHNTNTDTNSQTIIIPPTSSSFSGTYYLGLLTINNITLPFQKGFIFDIQPEITFSCTTTNVSIASMNIIFDVSNTVMQNPDGHTYQTATITAI